MYKIKNTLALLAYKNILLFISFWTLLKKLKNILV